MHQIYQFEFDKIFEIHISAEILGYIGAFVESPSLCFEIWTWAPPNWFWQITTKTSFWEKSNCQTFAKYFFLSFCSCQTFADRRWCHVQTGSLRYQQSGLQSCIIPILFGFLLIFLGIFYWNFLGFSLFVWAAAFCVISFWSIFGGFFFLFGCQLSALSASRAAKLSRPHFFYFLLQLFFWIFVWWWY